MSSFGSPLKIMIFAWLFLFCLYYSGIIVYNDVPDGTWEVVYIAAFLAIFASGYLLTVERKKDPPAASSQDAERGDTRKEEIHRLRFFISIFAVCGIVAALLFSYEMIFIVQANPFDMLSTREMFLEREVTIYSQISAVLGAGGFICLVSVILCWEYVSPFYKIFWLISPLSLSVFSVFSAGRQTVLQLILIPLIAWSLKRISCARSPNSNIAKIIIVMFTLLVLGYGMIAAYQRNASQIEFSKKDILMRLFDAQLHPKLDDSLEDMPPVVRDGVSEMVVYFSHEIPSYIVFFGNPRPEIYFGLWEFPFMARRLNSLRVVSYSVEEKMEEVYGRFEASGRFSQVWPTGIRDLILDFGLAGTIVMAGLLGFVSGRVYRRFESKRNLSTAYLLVGINLCCAYSIMLSAISDTLVFFYMVIAVMFYMRDLLRAPATRGHFQNNVGF